MIVVNIGASRIFHFTERDTKGLAKGVQVVSNNSTHQNATSEEETELEYRGSNFTTSALTESELESPKAQTNETDPSPGADEGLSEEGVSSEDGDNLLGNLGSLLEKICEFLNNCIIISKLNPTLQCRAKAHDDLGHVSDHDSPLRHVSTLDETPRQALLLPRDSSKEPHACFHS